jgi:hypothetical protein
VTTVWESEGREPQTHAFLVGVGAYRHLLGGSGPLLDTPMGLGQLSSPPVSARAFADWLLATFNNPDCPLGSVEMVLSPHSRYALPDGSETDVEPATIGNIKAAFKRWFDRCETNERNIAVFYCCSHGVQKENLALLAEDFGESPLTPFDGAIDFEATYLGMAGCKAGTQCYFIDSCRQVPTDVLEYLTVDAEALVAPMVRGLHPRDAPVLYASARDARAYGLAHQTTRFTEALLLGFGGLGSWRERGRWVITTGRLAQAVVSTVERMNREPEVPPQHCQLGGESQGTSVVHVLRGEPLVPVTVGCSPTCATADAELSLVKDDQIEHYREPRPGDWEVSVKADKYDVHACFPAGSYRDRSGTLWALPPHTEERLEVAR